MSRTGTIVGVVGLVLLVIVLVFQVVLVLPRVTVAGTLQEPTGITVMAQGKASAEPDLAMITIGVQTRDAEARTAAEKNDDRMNEVMGALLQLGIAEEDIQTVDYSVRPEIDWEDDEQRVIGYVVSNSVMVKLREVDRVGDVLDAATAAGANNVQGIQFTFDDPSALREEARAEAMAEAQMKAEALAELAGVRLGRPRYINESFIESPPYYLEPIYAVAAERAVGGGAPIQPGQLEIAIQVQVTYEIG